MDDREFLRRLEADILRPTPAPKRVHRRAGEAVWPLIVICLLAAGVLLSTAALVWSLRVLWAVTR